MMLVHPVCLIELTHRYAHSHIPTCHYAGTAECVPDQHSRTGPHAPARP